jgi:predicted small lipoprotein YifL
VTRKGIALVAITLALAGGLSACGKRGDLEPPKGEEAQYTYPHVYPKPSTVLPAQEPEARPRSLEKPRGAGGISVFPSDERTRTYGEPLPE